MTMIPWRTRLRRKRSIEGVIALYDDAASWELCAIGERREQLGELGVIFDYAMPQNNPYICRLGCAFFGAVSEGNKAQALDILDKIDKWIEKRT